MNFKVEYSWLKELMCEKELNVVKNKYDMMQSFADPPMKLNE